MRERLQKTNSVSSFGAHSFKGRVMRNSNGLMDNSMGDGLLHRSAAKDGNSRDTQQSYSRLSFLKLNQNMNEM